jgi:tetratricopeptide (TPR) repeat protein
MTRFRPATLIAALALAGFVAGSGPARANPSGDTPPPPPDTKSGDQKKTKKDKQSYQDFQRGYRAAFALIQQGDYAGGISAMRALGRDEQTDVATEIGFAYRKLGNYDASQVWYEKALVSNPNNTRTLQYYGEWYLEQGNRLKARDNLQKIRLICGPADCKDYVDLKTAIDTGRVSY